MAVMIIGLKKNWFVRYNSRQQKKISVKLIVLLVVMSGMIAVIVVSVVTLLKQTNSKNDTTAIDQTDMLLSSLGFDLDKVSINCDSDYILTGDSVQAF